METLVRYDAADSIPDLELGDIGWTTLDQAIVENGKWPDPYKRYYKITVEEIDFSGVSGDARP